jgi:hypothetical protein
MILLAKAALGLGAVLAFGGAYLFHDGVIRVDVDETGNRGPHAHFWVPATAVSVGLRLTPRHSLERVAEQSRAYLPLLREIAKELQKYPNVELLEVRGGSDHVRVVMQSGKLSVDAVTGTDRVHISCPVATIADLADRLEDAAPGI